MQTRRMFLKSFVGVASLALVGCQEETSTTTVLEDLQERAKRVKVDPTKKGAWVSEIETHEGVFSKLYFLILVDGIPFFVKGSGVTAATTLLTKPLEEVQWFSIQDNTEGERIL